MNYNFFDYKDFIIIDGERYHGQDYFSLTHIIFMVLATIAIVLLCVFLRKASHKKIDIYLKVLSIFIPLLEVIKISWETYFDIKLGHGFNYSGLIPIYTCSMFIYVLPFVAFGKGKVKEYATAWLGTICIFAGFTNFYLTQILHDYPFWTFATFQSVTYHFLMSFTGIFLVVTGYFKPKWKDIIKGYIPILIFSIPIIPINYYLNSLGYNADYMLYMWGNGAPVLPDMANFFSSHDLHLVYTFIVMFGYILVAGLVISIEKGVIALINKRKKVKT